MTRGLNNTVTLGGFFKTPQVTPSYNPGWVFSKKPKFPQVSNPGLTLGEKPGVDSPLKGGITPPPLTRVGGVERRHRLRGAPPTAKLGGRHPELEERFKTGRK